MPPTAYCLVGGAEQHRLPLQDLRSTAFRYLLRHGVPGPTWGDREFLPTARRPGRTRQGGASPQLLRCLKLTSFEHVIIGSRTQWETM